MNQSILLSEGDTTIIRKNLPTSSSTSRRTASGLSLMTPRHLEPQILNGPWRLSHKTPRRHMPERAFFKSALGYPRPAARTDTVIL